MMRRGSPSSSSRDLKDQIIDSSKKDKKNKKRSSAPPDPSRLIPTGSTLLNCACSDSPWGGYGLGKLANLIGDSSAGKTLLALTTLAEVCQHKRFADYRLIFDDAEHALEFDMKYLFGPRVAKRIGAPQGTHKKPTYSKRMDNLQSSILKAVKHGQPFIYILDCLDALTTKEEEEKAYKKALKSAKTETEAKEIKDAHKAKKAGDATQLFRLIDGELKETDSTLIIISQVRDLIGAMPYQSKKTRSGGRALKFYSTHEMWMVITGREKRQGKGKKKQEVGITANIKVSKNKLTGKVREIPIRIWNDYGIDDLSVNIEFLVAEEYWDKENRGKHGQFIIAEDLNLEPARMGDLIQKIEERELEDEIRKLVGECWNEIEESLKISRKPRYT